MALINVCIAVAEARPEIVSRCIAHDFPDSLQVERPELVSGAGQLLIANKKRPDPLFGLTPEIRQPFLWFL